LASSLFFFPVLYYRRVLQFGNPHNLVGRMVAFVVMFLLTWTMVAVQRLYQFFDARGGTPLWLLIPHCIAVSGQGAGNFIVWASSPAINLAKCKVSGGACTPLPRRSAGGAE
jgi:hypothetical protein